MGRKILVLAKEVSTLEDEFEISGTEVEDKYVEFDLNNLDEYAVEEAVQIKEESEDEVEVVVASIGPERSEETIRMTLAKEADRAIRVWDDPIESRTALNPASKSTIFSRVVEEEDPDLILCGAQAEDDLHAATGVHLAEEIDWQWAAVVISIDEYDPADGTVELRRELEGGVEEKTRVDLPAVLTIQSGINQPRYASLRGIRQAQSKELDVLTLGDLGLDESDLESPIELVDMYQPETETETTYLDGSAEDIASKIYEIAEDRGVA